MYEIVTIDNASFYDDLFVYLIPQGTSNFRRLSASGENFKGVGYENMTYDVLVIAHHESRLFAAIKKEIKPGKHYFNRIIPSSEEEVKEMLPEYYRLLNDDQQKIEQLHIVEKEINIVRDKAKMRREMRRIVFPCGGDYSDGAPTGMIYKEKISAGNEELTRIRRRKGVRKLN